MLSRLGLRALRAGIRSTPMVQIPKRNYEDSTVLQKREHGEFFSDPQEVSDRLTRMIAVHDNCIDPSAITLGSTFSELGLSELDMVEVTLMAEREFDVWIPEDDCERFQTVGDLAEWLCKNFYTK